MGWEPVMKHGKDNATGRGVFVHQKNDELGEYEVRRIERITHSGTEPLPEVPRERVPIDDIDLEL